MFVCPECGASSPAGGRCNTDGTQLAPVGEDLLLGTTIGVYRVARLLGIGGMGRVYKGVHPAIGSRVAIKVLSRECSDRRELVDRFFAEAKAVNLIRHESIVNVLDLATLPDGRPYIIMEYLDGAPLAAIIEHAVAIQQPLPLGGVARLAAEVLDALGAAHGKNIVHRDLKPDNVFVAPSGRPKVLDFGIAKLSDVTNTSTRTGSLLGTPHYMSPEQAAGRVVDHRADLYAIGVILFECATGRKPFLADALFDLLRMHVESPPPSPRQLRPDMPPELEQVIMTALAKGAGQRFATANAMSLALQHATSQLGPDAWRPLTPPSTQAASQSWAPTPPSSWSGSNAGSQSRPPPQMGHLSTVSAGQVTRGAKPAGSRRGLWLGLAGVLVIGGVTAAAVLGGGGGKSEPASPTVGSATAPVGDKSDPWSAGAKPAQEPAKPEPHEAPEAGSAAQVEAAEQDTDEGSDFDAAMAKQMAELDKMIEDSAKLMTPAQRKQMEAYRNLSKLPVKERMKKLRELAAAGGIPEGLGAPTPDKIAKAADEPAESGEDTDEPPSTSGSRRPQTGWISSHSIDAPPGYDAEHLDVAAFIPWAIQRAKQDIPDAQLIRIDTNGVGPDGRANLKLATLASPHGSIDVRFISPSRGKRDPKLPLGAAQKDFKCEFRIEATPSGVEMMPIDFADCSKEHVVAAPRCSFTAVWKKAIARKAPSQNVVGNLGYRSNGQRTVWYFDVGFGFDVAFSQMFQDDC